MLTGKPLVGNWADTWLVVFKIQIPAEMLKNIDSGTACKVLVDLKGPCRNLQVRSLFLEYVSQNNESNVANYLKT